MELALIGVALGEKEKEVLALGGSM